MANKRAQFKVDFSVDKLSIKEADALYGSLMKALSFDMKDRLTINITDLLGGKHDIFHEVGFMPDGSECKCVRIDCADCPKWQLKQKEVKNGESNE